MGQVFEVNDANDNAVFGRNDATSTPADDGGVHATGIFGLTFSPGAAGVFGANNGPQGPPNRPSVGVQGNGADAGVSGFSEQGAGVAAHSNHGNAVEGFGHDANGNAMLALHLATTASTATDGSPHGCGILAVTTVPGAAGVFGANNDANKGVGVQGNGPTAGVSGFSSQGPGVLGQGIKSAGIEGFHGDPRLQETTVANDGANAGVFGASDVGGGVVGYSRSPQSFGVIAFGGVRASAIDHPFAGEFNGAVQVEGNLTVTGDVFLPGADCAEQFDVEEAEVVEPGTVMIINKEGRLQPSDRPYDRKVAGVVSGAGDFRPALVLDRQRQSAHRMPIAVIGKVYCKVDATLSPVEVGDLLTTSTTPGYAMRADDPFQAFGAVIGKALKPLASGRGLTPILIALQ